ncbi:MAG: sporulation protein [Eubacterium sp.]|nr:sporulation protein [Eubacterium sp.]
MNNGDFNQTISSLFKGLDQFLTSKTVVGEPIQAGDMTIIPLMDVNFSMGAGAYGGTKGNSNAAGGMGGKLSPSSIIVIKNGYAQILGANEDKSSLSKVIDMVPEVVDKVQTALGKKKGATAEDKAAIEDVRDNLSDEEF